MLSTIISSTAGGSSLFTVSFSQGDKIVFESGLAWRIRSLFEKALSVFEVSGALELWLAYMRFEVSSVLRRLPAK